MVAGFRHQYLVWWTHTAARPARPPLPLDTEGRRRRKLVLFCLEVRTSTPRGVACLLFYLPR